MGEREEPAGCVSSAVGSLSVAQLRLAGAAEANAVSSDCDRKHPRSRSGRAG
jgi:hypothetical protein